MEDRTEPSPVGMERMDPFGNFQLPAFRSMDYMNYGLKSTPTSVNGTGLERYGAPPAGLTPWMNPTSPMGMTMHLAQQPLTNQVNCRFDDSNASMPSSSSPLFSRSQVNDKLRSKLLGRQSVSQTDLGTGPLSTSPLAWTGTPSLPGGKRRPIKSERLPKANSCSQYPCSSDTPRHCHSTSAYSTLPCRPQPLPTSASPLYYGSPSSSSEYPQVGFKSHTTATNCQITATTTVSTVKVKQEPPSYSSEYSYQNTIGHQRPYHKGYLNNKPYPVMNTASASPSSSGMTSPHLDAKPFRIPLPPFDTVRHSVISSLPAMDTIHCNNHQMTRSGSSANFQTYPPSNPSPHASPHNVPHRSDGDLLRNITVSGSPRNPVTQATTHNTSLRSDGDLFRSTAASCPARQVSPHNSSYRPSVDLLRSTAKPYSPRDSVRQETHHNSPYIPDGHLHRSTATSTSNTNGIISNGIIKNLLTTVTATKSHHRSIAPNNSHTITTPLPIHPHPLPPFSSRFNTAFNSVSFDKNPLAFSIGGDSSSQFPSPYHPRPIHSLEVSVIRRTPTSKESAVTYGAPAPPPPPPPTSIDSNIRNWSTTETVPFVHEPLRLPASTFYDHHHLHHRMNMPTYFGTETNVVQTTDFHPQILDCRDFTSGVPPMHDDQVAPMIFDPKPVMDFSSFFPEISAEYECGNGLIMPSFNGILSAESMQLTEEANRLERLRTNAKLEAPPCSCNKTEDDTAPFYTNLGTASSLPRVREMMEQRTGLTGEAIRIEKLWYTGKEGKTAQGCPIAKWIVRRAGPHEKYLVLARHREGHSCPTAWIVVVIVAWEGVASNQADDLYDMLIYKLTKFGFQTQRRCGTNERRTCACQGVDSEKAGASYSFGCSWSMYYNGCKYARSKNVHKFKLTEESEEPEVEEKMQRLATHLSPVYKRIAPEAYRNQTEFEELALECRLGNQPGRPWTGVTACVDFCAHAHKDIHNMNNGCTVVVTLTRHRGYEKPDDEQLHVLPLYVLDTSDEFGSREAQESKVKTGSLEILNKYPMQLRFRSVPLESCRKRAKPGKKRPYSTASRAKNRFAKGMMFTYGCSRKKAMRPGTLSKKRSDVCKRKLFQDVPSTNGSNVLNSTGPNVFNSTGPNVFNSVGSNVPNSAGSNIFNPTGANVLTSADSKAGSIAGHWKPMEQSLMNGNLHQPQSCSNPFGQYPSSNIVGHDRSDMTVRQQQQQQQNVSSIDFPANQGASARHDYRPQSTTDTLGECNFSALQLLSEAVSLKCEQEVHEAARHQTPMATNCFTYPYAGPRHQSNHIPEPPKPIQGHHQRFPIYNHHQQLPFQQAEPVQHRFSDKPVYIKKEPTSCEAGLENHRIKQEPVTQEYRIDPTLAYNGTRIKMEKLHQECWRPPSAIPQNHCYSVAATKTSMATDVPSASAPVINQPSFVPLPSFQSTYMSFSAAAAAAASAPSPVMMNGFGQPNPSPFNPLPGGLHVPLTIPIPQTPPSSSNIWTKETSPSFFLPQQQRDRLADFVSDVLHQMTSPPPPQPPMPFSTFPMDFMPPDFDGMADQNPPPISDKEESFYEVHSDNEENFHDSQIGGVAIALAHGSVLFECAKHELHATTALKNPNREHPARISLVFYQHKNMNYRDHGWKEYEEKMKLKIKLAEEAAAAKEAADVAAKEAAAAAAGKGTSASDPGPLPDANGQRIEPNLNHQHHHHQQQHHQPVDQQQQQLQQQQGHVPNRFPIDHGLNRPVMDIPPPPPLPIRRPENPFQLSWLNMMPMAPPPIIVTGPYQK